MGLKGYILTLDSILALGLTLMIILLISNQVFEPRLPRSLYLRQISQDVLTLVEKDRRIDSFVSEIDSSEVREVIQMTEESVCIRLDLLDQNGVNKSLIKQGCDGTTDEIQVSLRFHNSGNENYLLKTYAWYRR